MYLTEDHGLFAALVSPSFLLLMAPKQQSLEIIVPKRWRVGSLFSGLALSHVVEGIHASCHAPVREELFLVEEEGEIGTCLSHQDQVLGVFIHWCVCASIVCSSVRLSV